MNSPCKPPLLKWPRMSADTSAVRAEEQLDLDALSSYLDRRGFSRGRKISVEQFPGGHSNLTYLLKLEDGCEYVLRRPPLGPVAPKAHDMAREHRILSAVHPVFPPAPAPALCCEDISILGAPFYLMERRRGMVVRRENPPEIGEDLGLRRRVGEALLDTLVQLHSIDVTRPPIAAIGKPAGFLERQLTGWSERWRRARTGDLPAMDRVMAWLSARLPTPPGAALLHNDYKLDNVMLDRGDPTRIVAVLDWEMSALGDPLIDLGILLCYWPQAGDPPERLESISPVTAMPGWPTRAELVDRYAAKTGRDVSRIVYYEIFALFKVAVVLQQIYHRYWLGQTTDERFAAMEQRVIGLIRMASDLAGEARF
jgi:aminoglycoside phosphotransferase (APT) family kinase protein